jgi:hypothetical protein
MANQRDPRAEPAHVRLTAHEIRIRELLAGDPAIKRYHFSDAIRALVAEFGCAPDCLVDRQFLPDAYRIDRAGGWIDLFEVEERNPISASKLEILRDWWLAWDDEDGCEFAPRLFVLHRYGQAEIDLRPEHCRA